MGDQLGGRRFTSRDTVPIVYEAGCAPGPVWTGVENLAPSGTRSPDSPTRSESLYRLRYLGPYVHITEGMNLKPIKRENSYYRKRQCKGCLLYSFFWVISLASEFYVPTFRNTVFLLHRSCEQEVLVHTTYEQMECFSSPTK